MAKGRALCSTYRERSALRATVSEIHAYPLRPEGFEEPLFHTRQSRRKILEHLAASEWLDRASEAPRPSARPSKKMQGDTSRQERRILASWREVDRWWRPDGGVDRVCYLLRRAGGAEEVCTRPPQAA